MGLIYGTYGGRSDEFMPGSCSYETGFCPHGVSYDEFKMATEMELTAMRVHEDTIGASYFDFKYCLQVADVAALIQHSCSNRA